MTEPLTFQSVILTLERFWAERGCLIWQPYYTQVGAGTMNPATFLRVLGPEPWNVAYVEPSIRPDDGRFGENPNRFQQHYQYQVILKPDPGNPQEIYLASLEALGVNPRRHDIRFVEDNWEAPAIGAWGLGWEVWLDGQEITQFTYFQQAGGLPCDPVAVEITYGLERILIALHNAPAIWDVPWADHISYGEVGRQAEIEHSRYYFDVAEVERLRRMYDLCEAEARSALAAGLVLPAYDYVLKCSHTFNVLDTRGAIGVTERAGYFGRMRDLARQVAEAYLEQRTRLEFPLSSRQASGFSLQSSVIRSQASVVRAPAATAAPVVRPSALLLEIGTEELPAGDLSSALEGLRELAPRMLAEARLGHGGVRIAGTPRRLVVYVEGLAPRQRDEEQVVKGPPANRAYDSGGDPTPAAVGFARSKGVSVDALEVRQMDGGEYVVAVVRRPGRPAPEVLAELLPELIAALKFEKTMRWNGSGAAFSRPIRWLVALLGEHLVRFEYAGVTSGRVSRGLRPFGSPEIEIAEAAAYFDVMRANHIIVDPAERRAMIEAQARALAAEVGGRIPDDPALLDEVANLVERPTALRGAFDQAHLALPRDVLVSVMKKHQRYFPVVALTPLPAPPILLPPSLPGKGERGLGRERGEGGEGSLLPYFIAIRNGDDQHLDIVTQGNEHVIHARFADADFFVREDLKQPLEALRARLATLTFQTKLGSMLDKVERVEKLTAALASQLQLDAAEAKTAARAAHLCKADLAAKMVIEMTSLQGVMGREYALRSGEPPEAAAAIFEHYLPRGADDDLPTSRAGLTVGLADRLDSLVGLFAAGLAPSGSADPFALRRAALGIVQILLGREVDLDLRAALQAAAALQPIPVSDGALAEAFDFLVGRLRVQLTEMGYRYDVVEAVLAERGHNPVRARQAVKELSAWVTRPDWPQTLAAYARCVRITRDQAQQFDVHPDKFAVEAERALFSAYLQVAEAVQPSPSIDRFFEVFVPIIPTISRFFEDVLVMDEDLSLRENRLGMLQRIAALTRGLADLSKLEGF